jgi:hypothetical protein
MKTGKFLVLVGFCVMSSVVFGQGQDYAFRVLINKGSSEVKSGDSWQAIKTGSSLNANDELKVPENAYLGLVHKSGKPIELKKSGNYKVADLASQVSGGTSVLNKYTDFILSSNSAEAKKNRLSATGAVSRGGADEVDVFLPKNQNSSIYNSTLVVKWDSKAHGPFVVTLKNMFEDELMKTETPQNSIEINLSDPKFASESAILVEVKPKTDGKGDANQYLIKRLSSMEQDKIKKGLGEINTDVNEQSALDYLLLGGFYEQHDLIIDALSAYDKAVKLAPDVPSFKDAYDEFLFRNKLKEPNPK